MIQEVPIQGKYNKAIAFVDKLEKDSYNQIYEMMSSKGYDGEEEARIMPDVHPGKGGVIGFTMPIPTNPLKIVVSNIGVDIGCGILALKLGNYEEYNWQELDKKIRNRVPMGFEKHDRGVYHMKNDFPYDKADNYLENMRNALDRPIMPENFDRLKGYSIEYFNQLCERAEYSKTTAINSVGTMGGGNHFIELCQTQFNNKQDELWAVIHSGSRGLGHSTARYWMQRATNIRNVDKVIEQIPSEYERYLEFDFDDDPKEIFEWVTGGKGESYKKTKLIKSDWEDKHPQKIQQIHDELKVTVDKGINDRAYLEGDETDGYIGDMIFLQIYAQENRRMMAEAVADAAGRPIEDTIDCAHNYIDFEDRMIRKGSISAREGERGLIPYNPGQGTEIVRGLGNDDWNQSAPHGAGRVMSRTDAKDLISMEEYEDQMDDVYSTAISLDTIDEAPGAYKDPELIMQVFDETVQRIKRLHPIINWKATS